MHEPNHPSIKEPPSVEELVPHNATKAHHAALWGGVSSALVLLLVYFLDLPQEVATALVVVVGALGVAGASWIGVYIAPRNKPQ